jgi:uncharacterized protein YndB with AHSA1/START domain
MIREGQVEHEARFPHPRERVWRALVDSGELAAWLMPNDFVPEVGRPFTLDARPELGIVEGLVLDADPPGWLRCRWSGEFGDTVVSFELTPVEGGTLLRIRHSGWTDEHRLYREMVNEGWRDKLASDLPALLGGTPVRPPGERADAPASEGGPS